MHVLLLCVVSVVIARSAQHQPPETKTFQVRLQHAAITRVPSPVSKPDVVRKPVAETFPLPEQQIQPLPVLEQHPKKHQTVNELPATKIAPLTARKKQARQETPVRQMPSRPQEMLTVANAFPTPVPPPTRIPTPVPTPKPVPVPSPTPIPTATPQPVETVLPTATATATRTPSPFPTLKASPTRVAADSPHSRPNPETPLPKVETTAESSPSTQERAIEQEQSSTSAELPHDDQLPPERQQALLKAYLEEIAMQLHKTKSYPRNARRKGWEGTVVIKLHLLPAGELEQAELAQSSGYQTLDDAALKAVQKAQPFPEFPEGVSAPSLTVNLPIQFILSAD
jgi:periplasmic protein TonB